MKSIMVTGYGRSGTKYLSQILNKSKKWSIYHEPRGDVDQQYTYRSSLEQRLYNEQLQYVFQFQHYGEVNSYLRFWPFIHDLPQKFLLLRNPADIFLSICNRKSQKKWDFFVSDLEYWYTKFDKWLDQDWIPIFFNEITTNVVYLNSVIESLGIDDLLVSKEILNKKINENRKIKYAKPEDLPEKYLRLYHYLNGFNLQT